ncbi:hypothetical protein JCM9279_004938 [Rhodotorula babjevae]
MNGSGLAPGYSISRAILSDNAALVRGDRFFTTDYNAGNLTSAMWEDLKPELDNGSFGGVIGKLTFCVLCPLVRSFSFDPTITFKPWDRACKHRERLRGIILACLGQTEFVPPWRSSPLLASPPSTRPEAGLLLTSRRLASLGSTNPGLSIRCTSPSPSARSTKDPWASSRRTPMTLSIAVDPAKDTVQTGFISTEECSNLHLIADGQGVFYGPASRADSADGAAAVLSTLRAFANLGIQVTLCPEGFARQPGRALGGGAAPTKLFRGTGEPQAARDGRVGIMTSGGPTQAVAAAAQSVAAGSLGPLIDSAQSRSEGEATVGARFAQALAEGQPLLSLKGAKADSLRSSPATLSTFSTAIYPPSHLSFHQHHAPAPPRALDVPSYLPTPSPPPDASTYASSPIAPFPQPQAVLTVAAHPCEWDALPSPAVEDASQEEDLPVATTEEWRDVQLPEPMSAEQRRAAALEIVIGGGPKLPWERRQAGRGDEQAGEGAGAAASGSGASEGEVGAEQEQEPEWRAAAVPAPRGVAAFVLDTDACALLPSHAIVVRRARVVKGGLIVQYYLVGDVLARMVEDLARSTLALHKTLMKIKLPPNYQPLVKGEDAEDVKPVVIETEADLDESGQPATASLEPLDLTLDSDEDEDAEDVKPVVIKTEADLDESRQPAAASLEPLDLCLDSDSDDDADSGIGVSASPVLGKRTAAVAFPPSSSGSDSELEIDEARSAPPVRASGAAGLADEDDGDVEAVDETFEPPPGSLRAADQPALVHLAQQWSVEELEEELKDASKCLEAMLLGSSLRDDDSSLDTHARYPKMRRFFGPTRLVALAFLARCDPVKVYNVVMSSGETSLHGFKGAMRSFVGRIVTLGTFSSYTAPDPFFLVTVSPLPAALSLLERLLNQPTFLPPDLGDDRLAPSPADIFRFMIRIGTLPEKGMSSLSSTFKIGTAEPGTRSPLAGSTSLWSTDERMAQVPPHVVAAAERRARPSAQSGGWSLPPRWQGSLNMWDERRGADEWRGHGWVPPEGPLAEEMDEDESDEDEEDEDELGEGVSAEDKDDGEEDAAAARRRAQGDARCYITKAAKKREIVGAFEDLVQALLSTPAWSSYVARGPPDDRIFVYATEKQREVGILSARLDVVLKTPPHLPDTSARAVIDELVDYLDDRNAVERFFPTEGVSRCLVEKAPGLAGFVHRFAAACEIPTSSRPLDTLLALEADGVFEPTTDSILSRSPAMLERALSSPGPWPMLARLGHGLKASQPGLDEQIAASVSSTDRFKMRKRVEGSFGMRVEAADRRRGRRTW